MRKQIVIASILKPVDDTRMFEKFAISLSNTNKYDVNIIGFCSKKYHEVENINFYPLFKFRRLSIHRILAPVKYLQILLKVKPELIIVTTPELLPVTCMYRKIGNCSIIYDIQENYRKNILYNKVYPKFIRGIFAGMVRKTETFFSTSVFHFLLAEACYEKELSFIGNRFTIIANKYKEPSHVPVINKAEEKLHFLYSGTIAINYGILEAIAFIKELHKHQKNVHLTIAGFCAQKQLLKELLDKISGCQFISIIGGAELVPHYIILGLIKRADFGLVPYQPDPSISQKIPTKLYEYLANKLPVILQNHNIWVEFCKPYNAALALDFNNFNSINVLEILRQKNFYNSVDPSGLFWSSEEKTFLQIVEASFSKKNSLKSIN